MKTAQPEFAVKAGREKILDRLDRTIADLTAANRPLSYDAATAEERPRGR